MSFTNVVPRPWLCELKPSRAFACRDGGYAMVQLPQYTPHAFRTTLIKMANDRCTTAEEFKERGMNIRHENMAVTMGPYLPLPAQRKEDLIKSRKPAYWR